MLSKKKDKVQRLKTKPAADNVGKGMSDDDKRCMLGCPVLSCASCLYSIHLHQDMATGCPFHTPFIRRLQLGIAMVHRETDLSFYLGKNQGLPDLGKNLGKNQGFFLPSKNLG